MTNADLQASMAHRSCLSEPTRRLIRQWFTANQMLCRDKDEDATERSNRRALAKVIRLARKSGRQRWTNLELDTEIE